MFPLLIFFSNVRKIPVRIFIHAPNKVCNYIQGERQNQDKRQSTFATIFISISTVKKASVDEESKKTKGKIMFRVSRFAFIALG